MKIYFVYRYCMCFSKFCEHLKRSGVVQCVARLIRSVVSSNTFKGHRFSLKTKRYPHCQVHVGSSNKSEREFNIKR